VLRGQSTRRGQLCAGGGFRMRYRRKCANSSENRRRVLREQ